MAASAAMREPTYFLLVTLLDGPLHGHGIIKRAEEISGGRVRLAAGTLYAALDRLAREGLVEAVHEETVNGRVRRYYALTVSGGAAVRAEADRMAQAASLVVSRPAARTVRPATRPAVRPA
ncbi:PadR family transcriptional regulator [Micromonospora sp. NPDC048999]|uniref:PadR family transcriptional regulator n=1 Tax=Micromonospora sp. NPDC048999 TaxID=3155391 RepID=UPI0033F5EA6E